jgi:hypothetical protein
MSVDSVRRHKKKLIDEIIDKNLEAPYSKDSGLRIELTKALAGKLSLNDLNQLQAVIISRKK